MAKKSKRISVQGADDVYLTKKNIAVRKIFSGRNGRIVSDQTKYYPRTAENMRIARNAWGRIRFGRN